MRGVGVRVAVGFALLVLLGCAGRLEASLARDPAPAVTGERDLQPAPGRFLVARRGFLDPFFSRSVIWLLQHDDHASFGLIINQPRERRLADVVADFRDTPYAALPVLHGGPVDPDMLVILLRSPVAPDSARHVVADVYASIKRQLLLDRPAAEPAGDGLRLFLGHVGWTPGQLAAEIARGDWHVVEGDPAIVFGKARADLWETLIRTLEPATAETPEW